MFSLRAQVVGAAAKSADYAIGPVLKQLEKEGSECRSSVGVTCVQTKLFSLFRVRQLSLYRL